MTLPSVTVTAQKEPEDAGRLPVSVTAVSADTIDRAGIRIVSEAGIFAPNVSFTEFTARKLSNPRFRGIGSSPGNPAVTTYIDGVPQLNANSSSIELLDVDQIEFVRGPQSALFGRNTLGGLVNVTSAPAVARQVDRADVGPVRQLLARGTCAATCRARSSPTRSASSAAFSYAERDGFTVNDVTGNDLDSRGAFSGKGQLLWTPAPRAGRRASSSAASARATATTRSTTSRALAREPRSTRRATSRATPTATSSARPFQAARTGASVRVLVDHRDS